MKLRWFIPIVVLLPLSLKGSEPVPPARIATLVINPTGVTPLHLRPDFDSVIRMPEEITSVVLGSPESFKAEHNEGEPRYVYVKPITRDPAVSNLMIATKSGTHVTLELISDGASGGSSAQAIDFLIEYRASHGFLVASTPAALSTVSATHPIKPDDSAGTVNVTNTSGSSEPSTIQTPRRRENGRPPTAQFAPRPVSILVRSLKRCFRTCRSNPFSSISRNIRRDRAPLDPK